MVFRGENFLILFLILAAMLSGIFMYHSELLSNKTQESVKTEDILIESNKAALAQIEAKNSTGSIFEDESVRKRAVQKFKDNFAMAMNYQGVYLDLVDYYVPCIFLVDDDGYYVAYSSTTIQSGAEYITNVITPLNTWTKTYGNYTVRYHLSDVVEIYKGNEQYSGNYIKAFAHFSSPSELSFMAGASSFHEEKNNVVCNITEAQINYYITTHNDLANREDRSYQFEMPEITDFNVRLMDSPCVISFAQGIQKSNSKGYINVYAFTAAIEDEAEVYYEVEYSGNLYYHTHDCSKVSVSGKDKKTATDCARDGYSPCPYCVR